MLGIFSLGFCFELHPRPKRLREGSSISVLLCWSAFSCFFFVLLWLGASTIVSGAGDSFKFLGDLVTVGIVGNVELEWHSMPSLKDKSWTVAFCQISSPRSVVMAFF